MFRLSAMRSSSHWHQQEHAPFITHLCHRLDLSRAFAGSTPPYRIILGGVKATELLLAVALGHCMVPTRAAQPRELFAGHTFLAGVGVGADAPPSRMLERFRPRTTRAEGILTQPDLLETTPAEEIEIAAVATLHLRRRVVLHQYQLDAAQDVSLVPFGQETVDAALAVNEERVDAPPKHALDLSKPQVRYGKL